MADLGHSASARRLQLLVEEAILQLPAVEQALAEAAAAAALTAGHSCAITYVTLYGALTVASTDGAAKAADDCQHRAGDGPGLEALRTGAPVRSEDTRRESRWGGYPRLAVQAGIGSSLSYPLMLRRRPNGAITVYSCAAGPWPPDQDAALLLLSGQVAEILQAVQDMARDVVGNPAAAAALREQHERDIATGLLMARRSCSSEQARALIAAEASRRGAPSSDVVSELLAGANRPKRA